MEWCDAVTKRKDPKDYLKRGRPSVSQYEYKPEYCDKLIEMGKIGGTIAMFCADLGIYKEIFYQWCEKYPEFSDAKKRHTENWEAYSDKIGVAAQAGKIKNFQLGVWVWNRKNKLKERDRTEIKHEAYFGDFEDNPERMDEAQLEAIARILKSKKR